MYAIIDDKGRQHKVEPGERLSVDYKKEAQAGEMIEFDQVLLVGGADQELKIGKPTLLNARVVAEVLGEARGPKLVNMRFRRRKDSQRKKGHRQRYTEVIIREIHPE